MAAAHACEKERAFDRLPPLQRAACVLVLRQDIPYTQAARILGIPLGSLKTLIHRAWMRLRRELDLRCAKRRRLRQCCPPDPALWLEALCAGLGWFLVVIITDPGTYSLARTG